MTARILTWKQPFIQRVRNSSLVEGGGVDYNRVLSCAPKPRDTNSVGRGAFRSALKPRRELRWSVRKSRCRYK